MPEWKFDLLRNAILTALKPGPVPFGDLNDRVRALLGEDELKQLGSLGWHVTTVKLELECRGELSRFKEKGRQMLMLVQ